MSWAKEKSAAETRARQLTQTLRGHVAMLDGSVEDVTTA